MRHTASLMAQIHWVCEARRDACDTCQWRHRRAAGYFILFLSFVWARANAAIARAMESYLRSNAVPGVQSASVTQCRSRLEFACFFFSQSDSSPFEPQEWLASSLVGICCYRRWCPGDNRRSCSRCYCSSAGSESQARRELLHGTWCVSHAFAVP